MTDIALGLLAENENLKATIAELEAELDKENQSRIGWLEAWKQSQKQLEKAQAELERHQQAHEKCCEDWAELHEQLRQAQAELKRVTTISEKALAEQNALRMQKAKYKFCLQAVENERDALVRLLDTERLASIFHDVWCLWGETILQEEEELDAGAKHRWEKYLVPYEELPEDIKEMDRKLAREAIQKARGEDD